MSWYQLNKNNFLKVKNVTLLFFILVCGLSYICLTPPSRQANQTNEQTKPSHYIPSKPRVEIIGLNYDLNFKGETKLQLKADRFLIRKKKLGLIRFGLAQEALFENAEVSFFVKKKLPSLQGVSNFSLIDILASPDNNYSNRLVSLVMAPVSIFFYDENYKVSQIHAKSASFNMIKKEFVFLGNVRMEAGGKNIKTNKLIFNPEKEEIYIPGNSLLEIQGAKKARESIISDVFLNSLSI